MFLVYKYLSFNKNALEINVLYKLRKNEINILCRKDHFPTIYTPHAIHIHGDVDGWKMRREIGILEEIMSTKHNPTTRL